MARAPKKPKKEASAQPQEVEPETVPPQLIYEAKLGTNGAVIRIQPPITQAQAIALRQKDGNVVVCGPDKKANSIMARDVEQAANGRWQRHNPHVNAGPNALPHYQPDPRGPTTGHTFYETTTKHAL
jgi:hypothetical protein